MWGLMILGWLEARTDFRSSSYDPCSEAPSRTNVLLHVGSVRSGVHVRIPRLGSSRNKDPVPDWRTRTRVNPSV